MTAGVLVTLRVRDGRSQPARVAAAAAVPGPHHRLTGTAMSARAKPHGRARARRSSTQPSWLSTNVARTRATAAGSSAAGPAAAPGSSGSGGSSGPPAPIPAMICAATASTRGRIPGSPSRTAIHDVRSRRTSCSSGTGHGPEVSGGEVLPTTAHRVTRQGRAAAHARACGPHHPGCSRDSPARRTPPPVPLPPVHAGSLTGRRVRRPTSDQRPEPGLTSQ